VDVESRSDTLFGRYQALRLYAAVARLSKPEFTTGELAILTATPVPQCSKELVRLVDLGLVIRTSRRGDYERVDSSSFWPLVDALAEEWGLPG
jgi:hypothetical protein